MKFIHMADCHVGGWRDPKMRELTHMAFHHVTDRILQEKPDFVIIAGDLFNTAIPGIDSLKLVVQQLQRLKDATIPVYSIAGSHDFSPSGKTMLDILEEAGLLRDVMRGEVNDSKLKLKFTEDKRTGVKLVGILGRRGSLDRNYYEDLDRASLEKEQSKKIFLFHCALAELKPKKLERMEASPASFLPKGFDYYAGGHVHIVADTDLPGYKSIVYPGPLFPASFSELEELQAGSFCIVEDWRMKREKINLKPVVAISLDAERKTPAQIQAELVQALDKKLNDALILIRVAGELSEGKVSEIDFRLAITTAYENGAYFVMKNTIKLTSGEYEEVQVAQAGPEAIEARVIEEHLGQEKGLGLDKKAELKLTRALMQALGEAQQDGENKGEYKERIKAGAAETVKSAASGSAAAPHRQ